MNTADLLFDDDENTAPSSLGNATDNDTQQSSEPMSRFTSRFIETTKRFMSSNSNNAPLLRKDSDEPVLLMSAGDSRSTTLIAGYLQKLGRNGKWQTRWFETNGEFLSYFKSAKRSKLLATLDLQKVTVHCVRWRCV
jgi:aspartokinase